MVTILISVSVAAFAIYGLMVYASSVRKKRAYARYIQMIGR